MSGQLDFGLGETAEMMRETVRRFTSDEIAPIAADVDATNKFPRHLWPKMGALGLHGITVEEEFGGLGMGKNERTAPKGARLLDALPPRRGGAC